MKNLVTRLGLATCVMLALSVPHLAAAQATASEAQLSLNAAQLLTDQTLSSIHGSLTVLATTGEIQSLDWDTMQPLLASLQQHCPPCAIWFSEPDGTYYTANDGLMDVTLTDREYFASLIGGEDVLGAVVVSKSTGKSSAVVAVPVLNAGEVVGVLGASVFLEDFAGSLAAGLAIPAGLSLVVVTAAGDTAYAIPAEGAEWFESSVKVSFKETAGTIEVETDGETITALHQQSAWNGWHYLLRVQ